MNTKTAVAVILIILGIVVLAYSGITYTTRGNSVDVLGVHVETRRSHFVPPFAGAIAVVGGLGLLVMSARKV